MIDTVFVLDVCPSSVADTLHVPISGTASVQTPVLSDVPVIVFEPFVAVTVAPADTVTISCGTIPSEIA